MARRTAPVAAPTKPPASTYGRTVLSLALFAGAGLFAYWRTWNNVFLFDDRPAIDENVALLAGDWWNAAFGARHQPLANRPLTCLSLVVDFAVFGEGPFGPHLTNLLLHLGNTLLLFATLRRALQAPNLAGRFSVASAHWLATITAAIWVVHPLGVDAVAYATQRSTLLFSGCLLAALYATQAAHSGIAVARWRTLAVAAMALGMASKEDMVAAPLLLPLFERALLLPSWAALRSRAAYYAAHASTWLVLLLCVANGPHNPTTGYAATGITAWQWLMTQAEVVVHYLRLVAWPHPLRGAYNGGVVLDFGEAVLPGLAVVGVLVLVLLCWRRWPSWGWLGALFFLLLAPTSTVFPIETEIVAERRMYLPMLFVLVPITLATHHLLGKAQARVRMVAGAVSTAAVVVALALVTRDRVTVYADETTFWADAYSKMGPTRQTFLSAQIYANHGAMLWNQGRLDEAHDCFERAVACPNPTAIERMHYAVSLHYRGRSAEAIAQLRVLARLAPDKAEILGSLGTCLMASHFAENGKPDDPRLAEAEDVLRRCLAIKPKRADYWNSLAYVLRASGRLVAAEEAYRRTTELSTSRTEPFLYRAELLEQLGRSAEIGPMFARLLAARPRDVQLRLHLAEIDAKRRDLASSARLLREVLQIEPDNAKAATMLRQVEQATNR